MRWPPVEKSCPVDMGNGGRKKMQATGGPMILMILRVNLWFPDVLH